MPSVPLREMLTSHGFQSFRISLVDVVDEVLVRLEADEGLRFTLDGQLATVDDYLEIRPEAEERIRALVQSGRLAIGPWQTLMDEFLVDGETTFRNLEAGLARAENFGSAMQVGYLPDRYARGAADERRNGARAKMTTMRTHFTFRVAADTQE